MFEKEPIPNRGVEVELVVPLFIGCERRIFGNVCDRIQARSFEKYSANVNLEPIGCEGGIGAKLDNRPAVRDADSLHPKCSLLCKVIDCNIESFTPGTNATSATDMARAEDPETPEWEKACLLARIAHRETHGQGLKRCRCGGYCRAA